MDDPLSPNTPHDLLPAPITGRVVADARETLRRIPDGGAGLIITDPPWDIHGGGLFDACCSYERINIEQIAAILADARRALLRGGHMYVFATAGREFVEIVTAFEKHGWRLIRVLAWDKYSHSGMDGCGPTRNPEHSFTSAVAFIAPRVGELTPRRRYLPVGGARDHAHRALRCLLPVETWSPSFRRSQ